VRDELSRIVLNLRSFHAVRERRDLQAGDIRTPMGGGLDGGNTDAAVGETRQHGRSTESAGISPGAAPAGRNTVPGVAQFQRAISCWRRLFHWLKWTRVRRWAFRNTITPTKTKGARNPESALMATTRGWLDMPPFCFTACSRTPWKHVRTSLLRTRNRRVVLAK
jgi:hypothetical protein